MEFLHLDPKAHVEIKCVSWIEIVKELVKIFKARPHNHANRWDCLVGNRAMLTSRLAQFVKLVEYPLICFFQVSVQKFHVFDRSCYGKLCGLLVLDMYWKGFVQQATTL